MSRKKYGSDAFFSKKQGLSLIELVIVASLLSTVLALAYSFWHFGFSSFVSAEKRSNVQQNIRLATDFIQREIRFSSAVKILDAANVPAVVDIDENTHYILLNNGTIEYRAKNTSKLIPENIAGEVPFALAFRRSSSDLLTVEVYGTANNAQPLFLSSQVRLENLRHFNREIEGNTPATAIRFERQTFNLPTALAITPSSVVAGTNFSQTFTLTLLNDTFSESFNAGSITLGGAFTGLAVSASKPVNAPPTVTLSGNLTRASGSGQIIVAGSGLTGGSALSAQVSVLTDAIFTLNILREGEGTTTPAVGSHQYAQGTPVTLNATATLPWQFHQWRIDSNTFFASEISVLMDNNKTATAIFRRPLTSIPGGSFVYHNENTYLKLTGANNRVMNLNLNPNGGPWLNADSRPLRSELEGGIWTNSLRIAGVGAYWTRTEHNPNRGDYVLSNGTFNHESKTDTRGVREALTLPGTLFAYSGDGTISRPFVLGN